MDTLKAGENLGVDGQLTSANGKYVLTMQGDGNLVLKDSAAPVWATGTAGSGAIRAELQSDGNLVLYTDDRTAVWSADTRGNEDAALVLQDDRNLVLTTSDGRVLWSSGTSTGEVTPPAPPAEAAAMPAQAAPAQDTAAAAAAAAQTYTVVSGDTLWGIAEQFYGNGNEYRRIAAANGIANPDAIDVGQRLVIPA